MATRKRWTVEEDKVLVQAIKAMPHHKEEAFRIASEKLGRTVSACSLRWYHKLSNPKSKYYAGCVFTMVSHSTRMNNRTTCNNTVKAEPMPKGIWAKIKKLLGLK